MADQNQVARLGNVVQWNHWRQSELAVPVDLSGADLGGLNLSGARLSGSNLYKADLSKAILRGATLRESNLCGANLSNANLSDVDLSKANLNNADLRGVSLRKANLYRVYLGGADLRGTDLDGADLRKADLRDANLSGVNLSHVPLDSADLRGANLASADLRELDLRGFNLDGTNFSRADLSAANLSRTQALNTLFKGTIFTGACLEDWNTNSTTRFDGAICEYIYLKDGQQERRPREGMFQPGEFAVLFQQAVDTVDLILADGIDWQAFFQSFQLLRCQYVDQDLSIQALEKKSNGAFVVRLEVPPEADKSAIEGRARELYETSLLLMEQRYRDVLQAKEGEIVAYREQSTNLMKITEILAARPPMTEIPKYDMRGAQFGGGFAETVQGDQIGGTINNAAAETLSLAEAAAEIQDLLKQLEASNPTATEADQTAFLNVMIPPTKRERFIGALRAAGGAAIEEVPYGAVLKALVEGWQRSEG